MAGLAHTIRSFQSGGLSPKEFFAQIDRALANEQRNPGRLLDILQEEHTNFPLPPDVYAEVQRRIEDRGGVQPAAVGDETRVLTDVGRGADSPPAAPERRNEPPGGETERIKGVGDTLNGRFVLEECLGFGGMGMVYKALDLRKLEASDRKPYIAIKVLNVQFRGHPKSLIALQREAKKAQALAHPNIVTVYDFDRDGAMVYLTMEYLSGKPLSQLLRDPDFKGMPCGEALHVVNGMGKALAYAHERGFVHCDLKPANVFLTDAGDVKVIDFGIARVFQKPEQEQEATVFDPGSLGGMTPAYASPEMIEHREPDPRDDIYALACITYELLTGRHPFDRLPATQARSAGLKPQRPRKLGGRQWRALCEGLALERSRRTPSVTRFLAGMNGERRPAENFALGTAALMSSVFIAATVTYFWEAQGERRSLEPAAVKAEPPRSSEAAAPPAPASVPAPSAATVAPLLAGVPCSALSAAVHGDALQVEGYLPASFGLARLRERLAALPGVGSLKLEVRQVSDAECPVIAAFAPYWKSNRLAGGASLRTRAKDGQLSEGEPLVLDITTPAYESYVHLDYYVLDGSVVHLVPSPRAPDNQAPPAYAATIGSLGNWVISKPFGSELIVLLVTPAPLFEAMRPENEPRADYLRAVEERLRQLAGKYGRERIRADFVQIATRARKP